jgi:hypothetical protein
MTIANIISELQKECCNSKGRMIKTLSDLSENDLLELQKDISERLAIKNSSCNIYK